MLDQLRIIKITQCLSKLKEIHNGKIFRGNSIYKANYIFGLQKKSEEQLENIFPEY
jgi:hypothetical protein